MKTNFLSMVLALVLAMFTGFSSSAQVASSLPGRTIVKMLPDYGRSVVYALNQANGSVPGTVLALNSTNGAIVNEIAVNLSPTDMAITPAGDTMYVINIGSRTISKIDLSSFVVITNKSISTPSTYSLSNPLYVAANQSNTVYFTDGAWGPEIYAMDYNAGTQTLILNTGGNQSFGAGGLVLNRAGNTMFIWQQYGWSAGYANSYISSMSVSNNVLTTTASGPSQNRDPLNTPIFIDGAERFIFNKVQKVSATNVSVLLTQFTENIYAISLDGSVAFGPTQVFNAQTGIAITNLFSTTVQTLSGDQKKLFRYSSSSATVYIYDMANIAAINGPAIVPTPANGSVVAVAPTNLVWSPSPTALGYDVYFGSSQSAVSTATPASPLYLGRVTSTSVMLGQQLVPGSTYYWRVDTAGFSATNAGPTWSFTVSPLTITPAQVSVGGIAGYNPANATLSLTSATATAWTAAVTGPSWMTVSATSGTSPSTVTLSFNTSALAAGTYTNNVEFTMGSVKVEVPVSLAISTLNVTKMVADLQRPYIYALQPPALSGQNGQLLFINTGTGNIDKTLPIGINPLDLTIHYGENRLYVGSWGENAVYVVDLGTQTLLPPLHLGTDVYKINAGAPGRVITEGYNQWININICNTSNGAVVASMFEREGDGETGPDGTTYFHCDNNISNAHVHKKQIANDVVSEVAGSNEHPYGTRNLVLCADGTRLFWNSYIYDSNLSELGRLGEEIYAATVHGDLALGGSHVYNARNGQSIYTWPFSTSVLAVSGDQQKVFLYNGTSHQIVTIPMSSIASIPGPGLNPTPPDGSVINPPLSQLSWSVSPFGLSYQVYFGSDQSTVSAATTNSPTYIGSTTSNTFALTTALTPGVTYYWRVDAVGFTGVTKGAVWSFTVSAVTVAPQTLSLSGVTGLPVLPQPVSISAENPTAWNLTVAQPWISASASSGVTPSSVTLNFNTTNLTAGLYTNQLMISANGITLRLPVTLQLFDLNASKIVADPNRNYVYVLHPGSGNLSDAFLLFLNTDTGVVEKVIPVGINPTDMAVNRFDDRLYISNWQHTQTHVIDLKTQTELAPLSLGTDVYKINGGAAGRIIIEGEDQWISVSLVNSVTGAVLASSGEREGDGEADPSGTAYYHCDNNISNAHLHKKRIINDVISEVANSNEHPYGTRNLVLAANGNRLFWNSYIYDTNLTELGTLGTEIYACSTNGAIAFGAQQAFDTTTRQLIYTLPVSSTAKNVDRMNQRLWYFNSTAHRVDSISMLTIEQPSITVQPTAQVTVGIGSNVNLSVTAIGLNPLSYQWLLAGTNLVGQTNYFLSLNSIQPPQQGVYQVVVSNPYGAVTSAVSQVTVLVPPALTQQPVGTNVLAGQSFTLSVGASGTAPLTYQWFFESTLAPRGNTSTLLVTNAQAANEGFYRVVVQNSAGSVTSTAAAVHVAPTGPTIVTNPLSVVLPASSNVTFSVAAIGSQPFTYKWSFNGTMILGASSSQFPLANIQATNSGSYQVVVSNSLGAATSSIATLTVTPAVPYFVLQPLGATLPAGTNWTVTSQAKGTEPISYTWQQNGSPVAGASQSALTLFGLKLTDSGSYTLIASNSAGTTTSSFASLVVTAAPPVFVQQPVSTNVLTGATVTFNSLANGGSPLAYQWYFQTNAVVNQTNRQLVLSGVNSASTGSYFVVVTNQFGSATSVVAQLTVNQMPTLQQTLSNIVIDAGATTSIVATVVGTSPMTYSWQFNSVTIPNATNSSLVLSNIQSAQTGFYRVTIVNAFGSASAQVRVSVFGAAGGVAAWGDNSGGQTNVPGSLYDVVAVTGGDYHSLALRHDGTLAAWGYNGDGQASVRVDPLRFVGIASGSSHNLAIRENGSVVAWGRNDFGQTNVPGSVANVLSVAAGDAHCLALLSTRTVVAWGDNSYGQTAVPQGLAGVVAIAAGRLHNLALKTNGTVVAWGINFYGESVVSANVSNVVAIAAGYLHSAALTSNGTVMVWGDNTYGQTNVPAGLSNVVAIAAGDYHTVALKSNGTVVAWGNDSFGQLDLPSGLAGPLGIASGYYHGLAITPILQLQEQLSNNALILKWTGPGVLQSAPSPTGPYTDIPCQGNSWTNFDMSASSAFFRVRR